MTFLIISYILQIQLHNLLFQLQFRLYNCRNCHQLHVKIRPAVLSFILAILVHDFICFSVHWCSFRLIGFPKFHFHLYSQ